MKTTDKKKKEFTGKVVSDKMDKTVVVSVARFIKDPKYGKYYKTNKKYHVHDEKGSAKVGDVVKITETKPVSKNKKFKIVD